MSEEHVSYIATKMVKARPMTKGAAKPCFSFEAEDAGYEVTYPDGYVSWCPKEEFERWNRPADGMTFGLAIGAMRLGHRVARRGWNGKGMWLALVDAGQWALESSCPGARAGLSALPWIGMRTADACFVPWLASQTDMLAEDWQVVE